MTLETGLGRGLCWGGPWSLNFNSFTVNPPALWGGGSLISPAPPEPSNPHSRWPLAQSVEGACLPAFPGGPCLLGTGEAPQRAHRTLCRPAWSFPFCFQRHRSPAPPFLSLPQYSISIRNTHCIAVPGLAPHSHSPPPPSAYSLRTLNPPPPSWAGLPAQPQCSHYTLHTFTIGRFTKYCIYLFLSAACRPQILSSSWQVGADCLAFNTGCATVSK